MSICVFLDKVFMISAVLAWMPMGNCRMTGIWFFYNQTQSPSAEISYSAVSGGVDYRVDLDRLPASIQRLVFTVSIDGSGTMGNIVSHEVTISQNGKKVASTPSGQKSNSFLGWISAWLRYRP